MFIQTEATPNPATLKFLPGQVVMDHGTADFREASSAAERSPLWNLCGRRRAAVAWTKTKAGGWDAVWGAVVNVRRKPGCIHHVSPRQSSSVVVEDDDDDGKEQQ